MLSTRFGAQKGNTFMEWFSYSHKKCVEAHEDPWSAHQLPGFSQPAYGMSLTANGWLLLFDRISGDRYCQLQIMSPRPTPIPSKHTLFHGSQQGWKESWSSSETFQNDIVVLITRYEVITLNHDNSRWITSNKSGMTYVLKKSGRFNNSLVIALLQPRHKTHRHTQQKTNSKVSS